MGEITGISWTDHTFNPWWGCWKIADECKNCYADTTAHRFASQFGELWGRTAARRFFGDAHWNEPLKWNAKAEAAGVRARVFCGSMCDWAEVHPDEATLGRMDAERARLWRLIESTPWLDWLLLTKRPSDAAVSLPWTHPLEVYTRKSAEPWANVWVGTTAGTRKALRENVPILCNIPAAVRFVSCEPLLEDIPATEWDAALRPGAVFMHMLPDVDAERTTRLFGPNRGSIHWLIVGDESGTEARACQPDWVRGAREAALRHGVAFHFKQWNGPTSPSMANPVPGERKGRKIHLPILDGKQWAQFPKSVVP